MDERKPAFRVFSHPCPLGWIFCKSYFFVVLRYAGCRPNPSIVSQRSRRAGADGDERGFCRGVGRLVSDRLVLRRGEGGGEGPPCFRGGRTRLQHTLPPQSLKA